MRTVEGVGEDSGGECPTGEEYGKCCITAACTLKGRRTGTRDGKTMVGDLCLSG